jgi:DNA-directed RNA polymerase subunit RPC12/RpoP
MLVKCICTNCAGHLEFEEENAGEKIDCPHCGFETILSLPGTRPPDAELIAMIRRRALRRRLLFAVAILLVAGGCGYALYRWGVPWIQDLSPSLDTTWKAMAVLLVGCAILPFAVAWLILPVVLFFQIRKGVEHLSRIAGSLEAGEPTAAPVAEESAVGESNEEQVAANEANEEQAAEE